MVGHESSLVGEMEQDGWRQTGGMRGKERHIAYETDNGLGVLERQFTGHVPRHRPILSTRTTQTSTSGTAVYW